MRTKEQILKQRLNNIHYINSDETHSRVIGAMQEYSDQETSDYRNKIKDLLLFCEPNGEVVNGFKSKDAIQALRNLISDYEP